MIVTRVTKIKNEGGMGREGQWNQVLEALLKALEQVLTMGISTTGI